MPCVTTWLLILKQKAALIYSSSLLWTNLLFLSFVDSTQKMGTGLIHAIKQRIIWKSNIMIYHSIYDICLYNIKTSPLGALFWFECMCHALTSTEHVDRSPHVARTTLRHVIYWAAGDKRGGASRGRTDYMVPLTFELFPLNFRRRKIIRRWKGVVILLWLK